MPVRWNYGGTVALNEGHGHDMVVICGCGHRAVLSHSSALKLWPPTTRYRDVARTLRCSRCGVLGGCELHGTSSHDASASRPWGPFSDYPEVTPESVARSKTTGARMARCRYHMSQWEKCFGKDWARHLSDAN
jgi:hypothetical protein